MLQSVCPKERNEEILCIIPINRQFDSMSLIYLFVTRTRVKYIRQV